MTLSAERLKKDREAALRIMAIDLGDGDLIQKFWEKSDPRFADLAGTTWSSLQEGDKISQHSGYGSNGKHHLRPQGWICGLRLAGMFEDATFLKRCGSLAQVFKDSVKGRDTEGLVTLGEVLSAGFPYGWLSNALKARLLQEIFPDKKMNADWHPRRRAVILVPVTFGHPL